MKTLVTGASGFVGSHFISHIGRGNAVLFPEVIDLVDEIGVANFIKQTPFDAVLHLAAVSSVASTLGKSNRAFEVNVGGTANLLRALQTENFKGPVLLVSSGEVYGAVDAENLPVIETQALNPRNPYAESKVAMENLVTGRGEFAGGKLKTVIVRPFNHIGPGQDIQFVVASFAAQLAKRRVGLESGPMQTGDLSVTRDFTDVRDIVRAYAMLLEKGAPGEIYNLGSGVEVSLQAVLDTLIEISGTNTFSEVDSARLRPGEQKRMCAETSKVRAIIDWVPTRKLRETLKDCFDASLAQVINPERIST